MSVVREPKRLKAGDASRTPPQTLGNACYLMDSHLNEVGKLLVRGRSRPPPRVRHGHENLILTVHIRERPVFVGINIPSTCRVFKIVLESYLTSCACSFYGQVKVCVHSTSASIPPPVERLEKIRSMFGRKPYVVPFRHNQAIACVQLAEVLISSVAIVHAWISGDPSIVGKIELRPHVRWLPRLRPIANHWPCRDAHDSKHRTKKRRIVSTSSVAFLKRKPCSSQALNEPVTHVLKHPPVDKFCSFVGVGLRTHCLLSGTLNSSVSCLDVRFAFGISSVKRAIGFVFSN